MLRTYAPCPCPRPRRFRSTAPVKIKKKLRRPERKLEINLTLSTQPANILLNQGNYTVSIIEGDGIGPEISQAVKDIFAAAKVCPENHSTELEDLVGEGACANTKPSYHIPDPD